MREIIYISNFTYKPARYLVAKCLLGMGLDPNIIESTNQDVRIAIEAVRHKIDRHLVVLAIDYTAAFNSQNDIERIDQCREWISVLKENNAATILMNNAMAASEHLADRFPSYENKKAWRRLLRFNLALEEQANSGTAFNIIDCFKLGMKVGADQLIDGRYKRLYNIPFSRQYLKEYADLVARSIRCSQYPPLKCVILDCDNTLWGGVVGEVGIEDLILDRDFYPGSLYYDFQSQLLQLAERGIALALCSRNDEETIWNVLEGHSSCLLKKEHFVAHRINWEDKHSNVLEIIDELGIGPDSCLFIDDNQFECESISENVGQGIHVLNIGETTGIPMIPSLLSDYPYFDSLESTVEDSVRVDRYRDESRRREQLNKCSGLEEFLKSINIKLRIRRAGPLDVPRMAQMMAKTNQFNFTGEVLTKGELMRCLDASDAMVILVDAKDDFGEYGTISIVLLELGGRVKIRNMLLSCRTLGKKIENTIWAECLKYIGSKYGARKISCSFRDTGRNSPAKLFLESNHGTITRMVESEVEVDCKNAWRSRFDAHQVTLEL